MRRRPIRKIEEHFIDVTPAPAFRRIVAFDDRGPGCMKMLGGMLAEIGAKPVQLQQ
jgi:hypothetical protein